MYSIFKKPKHETLSGFDQDQYDQYNNALTLVIKAFFQALREINMTEFVRALRRNPKMFKEMLCETLKSFAKIFFIPLSDEEAVKLLIARKKYDRVDAKKVVGNWRKLAIKLGYTGPVAWMVYEGFIFKTHAPRLGPCFKNFDYLQDWLLEDDKTKNALAFFIPRFIAESKNKNPEQQLAILRDTRELFEMPEHHLSSFGGLAMLSGLILTHLKYTGERVPHKKEVVRTDTYFGHHYVVLGFIDSSLFAATGGGSAADDDSRIGCFPLGVEEF